MSYNIEKILELCLQKIEESDKKIIQEQEVPSDIQHQLIQFFSQNPNPKDSQVEDFGKELGLQPDTIEEQVYILVTDLLSGLGKHKNIPDSKFDSKELEMGEEVELEHTDNRGIAKEISKDHLSECSKYYTFLKTMESKCKDKDVL